MTSDPPGTVEISIVMPCLDEAETVGVCVVKASSWLERSGVSGEVIVADNGSQDGSRDIAERAGARVVPAAQRGYGAALQAGIAAARGRFIIMGDADDSYDFTELGSFLRELRDGADLVMGNRFQGGIENGAMPFLHRYLGNPVLSWLGRLFFKVPVGDFHCGLRGFRRDAIRRLHLRTTGMEFASEMVVKSSLHGLDIREVPTVLRPDGRSGRPHLRTWRDGWRHLRFLLLLSPRWLFLIPGAILFTVGLALTAALVVGPVRLGSATLDIGALVYAAALAIVGSQAVGFALFAKVYAVKRGLLPADDRIDRFGARFGLERGLALGALAILAGLVLTAVSFWRWRSQGWSDLDPSQHLRVVVPAALGIILGLSTVLGSFFLSILGMDQQSDVE